MFRVGGSKETAAQRKQRDAVRAAAKKRPEKKGARGEELKARLGGKSVPRARKSVGKTSIEEMPKRKKATKNSNVAPDRNSRKPKTGGGAVSSSKPNPRGRDAATLTSTMRKDLGKRKQRKENTQRALRDVGGRYEATPEKAKGGKMPMVTKNGKRVPAFAADGVGKMAKGGKMKSSCAKKK